MLTRSHRNLSITIVSFEKKKNLEGQPEEKDRTTSDVFIFWGHRCFHPPFYLSYHNLLLHFVDLGKSSIKTKIENDRHTEIRSINRETFYSYCYNCNSNEPLDWPYYNFIDSGLSMYAMCSMVMLRFPLFLIRKIFDCQFSEPFFEFDIFYNKEI